ncbi:preprotein translocase subunit SecG [Leisingera methylohalidivorans]|uniref:Protein-export membrane protein SecG n=1 Tax=Leisingera methylohalidivorans DSM 14336 TaxID=999552 RepID=V9VSG0_9RHOB|nr:preprotein translocase subunit SecG [Leisingera methylohalidivorans]AHD00250.1 preprotein translocase subunit SecG [Leisingera methylohalidivorans DSM 14336]
MENVVLIIHLLLALGLIAVVLLQRSEGGGLGMGGGGGGGAISGRAAATALSRLTWLLAIAFICTSITLTVLAAQKSAGASVTDRLAVPQTEDPGAPAAPLGSDLLPPSEGDNAPLVPSAD